ncbi:MAG: hypothetical protein ACOZE5_03395 [Verrucomicrobiota bacterium]
MARDSRPPGRDSTVFLRGEPREFHKIGGEQAEALLFGHRGGLEDQAGFVGVSRGANCFMPAKSPVSGRPW